MQMQNQQKRLIEVLQLLMSAFRIRMKYALVFEWMQGYGTAYGTRLCSRVRNNTILFVLGDDIRIVCNIYVGIHSR
jgi:hypothetical protein